MESRTNLKRIPSLTRLQWETLKRALAFKRSDRVGSIDEFLRLFARRTWWRKHRGTLGIATLVVVGTGMFFGTQYYNEYVEDQAFNAQLWPGTEGPPPQLTVEQQARYRGLPVPRQNQPSAGGELALARGVVRPAFSWRQQPAGSVETDSRPAAGQSSGLGDDRVSDSTIRRESADVACGPPAGSGAGTAAGSPELQPYPGVVPTATPDLQQLAGHLWRAAAGRHSDRLTHPQPVTTVREFPV